MGIKAGLVGLPNVGKSTLFNALTKSSVPAENYPFCTIDPHVAITEVPDPTLEKLGMMYGSQKIIPAHVTFVDIAGLVKGAAQGEGLGNQFLSTIREVDLILHVLKCFDDETDPLEHYEIIISELALKDLESIEKRLNKIASQMKGAHSNPQLKRALEQEQELLLKVQPLLNTADIPAICTVIAHSHIKTIPLLCAKKFLIVANITESDLEGNQYTQQPYYTKLCEHFGANNIVIVSAKIEHEISQLEDQEQRHEYMDMVGLESSGLDTIIKTTFTHLDLIRFFTCGPKESHAWTITRGTPVRTAAGEIHSDLERGFICAELFSAQDFISAGNEYALKESGKLRKEGQDYVVQDGDVINVRFNV